MTPSIPVADGALALEPREEDAPLLDRWLPRPHPTPLNPVVRVALSPLSTAKGNWLAGHCEGNPTFSLGPVRGWVDPDSRRVALTGHIGTGVLDLPAGRGEIDPAGSLEDGYTMLTLAAGLLLASRGLVLVHAGAVRRPDGGVLLIAGDTHSGKSTTALTLARADRWAWLSDDQVLLSARPDDVIDVFGWVRRPHLDQGYDQGVSVGTRQEADPDFVGSLPWVSTGALAGSVLPVVRPEAVSGTSPAKPGDALEALIRQGAWIMAEREAARAALRVLKIAAGKPAYRLELGRDTFAAPERLARVLT